MNAKKTTMNASCSRTFGLVVGWVGMLVSGHAYALSLAGFQVQSALDEPLRAEIRLDSVDSGTLESLEVTLGSSEDFQRADVPRSEFLQQLEFSVSSEAGVPVVVVTTEQPVKEPFLHFLVAAEWSGGKLVREYTGLLDPPLYAADKPASVDSPTLVTSGEMTQPESTSMASEPASGSAPSLTTTMGASGRSAEYGPTQQGDTLWEIASRLDTASLQVNVFQVMIALLRENPDAFIDNNVNLLKTGQILQLQDLASLANVSTDDAAVAYAAQLEEWESYKSRLASTGSEVQVAGSAASTNTETGQAASEGTESASAGDQAAGDSGQQAEGQAGAGEQEDVLRIVQATLDETAQSEAESAGSDQSGEIAELRGQIATLEESLESRNLENQELQERVRLLESQLENAQRLVEIESQELAAAQQQAAELAAAQQRAEEEARQAQQMAAQSVEVVEAEPEQAQASRESGQEAGQESNQESSQEPEQSAADTGNAAVEQETASTQQAAAVTPTNNQQASESAQSTERVRKVANRPPSTSWWSDIPDMLFSSWMWMVGAGVGVLVLLLGLLMFLRRRQSIAEFEESILSGSALDSYSETTDTAGTSASDTSFLSDFGTAGMGTMQADEVDPLAEAEVYLAYGRDEQAEEVLKEAARRDPDRSEVKLKLLEIYKQRKDVKSFETIAEELYPAGDQGDHETWRQVSAMGRELSPDNPLFQDTGGDTTINTLTGTTNPSLQTTSSAGDTGSNVEKTVATTGQRAPAAPATPSAQDSAGLDLDLDAGRAEPAAPARTASAEHGTLNQHGTLNLGDDILHQTSGNVDPATQPFPTPDQQTDLDLELDRLASERETGVTTGQSSAESSMPDTGLETGDEPSRNLDWDKAGSDSDTLDFPASDTSEIEFDLNLDESSIQEITGTDSEEKPRASNQAGDGLMEFESDNIPPEETWAGASTDAAPGSADDDSVSYSPDDDVKSAGAPQYNEAETKLDLARAYLDMGDKVGARSIIDEVMREGDPAQRDQAAELASQL